MDQINIFAYPDVFNIILDYVPCIIDYVTVNSMWAQCITQHQDYKTLWAATMNVNENVIVKRGYFKMLHLLNVEKMFIASAKYGRLNFIKYLESKFIITRYMITSAYLISFAYGHLDVLKHLECYDYPVLQDPKIKTIRSPNFAELLTYVVNVYKFNDPSITEVQTHSVHILSDIVRYTEDINIIKYVLTLRSCDTMQLIPLCAPIKGLEFITYLKEHFADKFSQCKGNIAVNYATNGYLSVIEYLHNKSLLDNDDINAVLSCASENNQCDILQFYGDYLKTLPKSIMFKLFDKASSNSIDAVQFLMNNHRQMLYSCIDGGLCLAAKKGRIDIVKYLHSLGASVTAYCNKAIKYAVYNEHLEIIKYLHKNGANLHLAYKRMFKVAVNNYDKRPVKYLHRCNILTKAYCIKIISNYSYRVGQRWEPYQYLHKHGLL